MHLGVTVQKEMCISIPLDPDVKGSPVSSYM